MTTESLLEQESQRIGWFFRKPSAGDPEGSRRSNLYVLRRDLCDILSPARNLTIEITAPMLAAIGMLSGIDLMAWTTTWPEEPTRADFVEFLIQYGGMAESEAQALYQYRCAQVHSYGLFSIRRQGSLRTEYTFTLDPSLREYQAIVSRPDAKHPHNYSVALFPLRDLFLRIIDKYEDAVKNDPPTRTAFLAAIEKIGFFHIEGWAD